MKRQFFALRILSLILKIVAILSFIGTIVLIATVLLDATTYPTLQSKLQPSGQYLGIGLGGMILMFAVAQMIDLQIAVETNTRATTALLQQLGRIMKERL